MAVTIPKDYEDLLTGSVFVTLCTIMPDGQPQATAMWCDYDGTYVLINTAEGRQKDKNLLRDPKVTILAIDPQNPYRWIEVRGKVSERTTEGALESIDALARQYTEHDRFYGGWTSLERKGREQRVLYKIEPLKVNTKG